MPDEVRTKVGKTFSVYPRERAEGALLLGTIGTEAFRSIPFLIRLLDDNMPVWLPEKSWGIWKQSSN